MIRELAFATVYMVMLMLVFWLLMSDARNRNTGVYYDCSLASFHPDIPPKVKEACRSRTEYEQDAAAIADLRRLQEHKK
jgi:hypothetical protein